MKEILTGIIKGFGAARGANKAIARRVKELDTQGYNGRKLPTSDYIYPLVRELGNRIEELYKKADDSTPFRRGMRLYLSFDDWFGPCRHYSFDYVHEQAPDVTEFDRLVTRYLRTISQGIAELVETLPPRIRTRVAEQGRLPPPLQGTVPYRLKDMPPLSRQ